jgi:hypothetical protein
MLLLLLFFHASPSVKELQDNKYSTYITPSIVVVVVVVVVIIII